MAFAVRTKRGTYNFLLATDSPTIPPCSYALSSSEGPELFLGYPQKLTKDGGDWNQNGGDSCSANCSFMVVSSAPKKDLKIQEVPKQLKP